MAIPKQVQKQSEDVQALYKELNGETEKNAEETVEDVSTETKAETEAEVPAEVTTATPSDSVEEQAPKSEAEEHSESDTEVKKESWQQKYKTLQGMYNTDVPRLNAANKNLNDRVAQLESLLGDLNKQETPVQETPVEKLITEDDVKEYGDSIDVMRRAAKEEVAGQLGRVKELEAEIEKLKGVVPQVQQVQQQQKTSSEQQFWNALNTEVPNWNEINSNPDFQSWLLEIDPLTGMSRQTYLEDAQKKLDSKRVISFFSTFEQATGNANSARETRSSNPELAKQVAPGRGRSAKPTASEGKTYTTADIKKFFEDVRMGKYKSREEERGKIERDIFAAQQEGRITNA
tara:strand:+ start:400 stop:1437 length:1038 start_codon:yes stop_codon:yes gene_type:complete